MCVCVWRAAKLLAPVRLLLLRNGLTTVDMRLLLAGIMKSFDCYLIWVEDTIWCERVRIRNIWHQLLSMDFHTHTHIHEHVHCTKICVCVGRGPQCVCVICKCVCAAAAETNYYATFDQLIYAATRPAYVCQCVRVLLVIECTWKCQWAIKYLPIECAQIHSLRISMWERHFSVAGGELTTFLFRKCTKKRPTL